MRKILIYLLLEIPLMEVVVVVNSSLAFGTSLGGDDNDSRHFQYDTRVKNSSD